MFRPSRKQKNGKGEEDKNPARVKDSEVLFAKNVNPDQRVPLLFDTYLRDLQTEGNQRSIEEIAEQRVSEVESRNADQEERMCKACSI